MPRVGTQAQHGPQNAGMKRGTTDSSGNKDEKRVYAMEAHLPRAQESRSGRLRSRICLLDPLSNLTQCRPRRDGFGINPKFKERGFACGDSALEGGGEIGGPLD